MLLALAWLFAYFDVFAFCHLSLLDHLDWALLEVHAFRQHFHFLRLLSTSQVHTIALVAGGVALCVLLANLSLAKTCDCDWDWPVQTGLFLALQGFNALGLQSPFLARCCAAGFRMTSYDSFCCAPMFCSQPTMCRGEMPRSPFRVPSPKTTGRVSTARPQKGAAEIHAVAGLVGAWQGLNMMRSGHRRYCRPHSAVAIKTPAGNLRPRVGRACGSQLQQHEPLVHPTSIVEMLPHMRSNGRFEMAVVPDPSFAGCQLSVVVRSGEFCVGDRAFLVVVGAQIPRDLSTASGWDGLLAESDYVVKPTYFGRQYLSNGLLLPMSVVKEFASENVMADPGSLTAELNIECPATAFRAHEFLLDVGFDGSCYFGSQSTGAEDERPTVVGQLMRCVERLGRVCGPQDSRASRSKWAGLSRVDAGASARSFLLATPPLINPVTHESRPQLSLTGHMTGGLWTKGS